MPAIAPPPVESVLMYCLFQGLNIAFNAPVIESLSTDASSKHIIRPLRAETTLIVEEMVLPFSLIGIAGFYVRAREGKETDFYGDLIVDDSVIKEVPDIFQSSKDRSFYCSDKAKSVVESEDPDAHQFVPISIIKKSTGEKVGAQFYGVIPGRFLYVKRDDSNPQPRMDYVEHPPTTHLLELLQQSTEAHPVVQDMPLWTHPFSPYRPYFSPRLYRALLEAGVSGIDELDEGQIAPRKKTVGHVFR